jgi:hypothetical protein
MKLLADIICSTVLLCNMNAQDLTQSYGGKIGFYDPAGGLNNGLLLGIDGITEFNNYNFFLSGALDFYYKETIDIFNNPKPTLTSQQVFIVPLHANFGYKIYQVPDAATKLYGGIGGGYYFYFYNANYLEGGIIPLERSASPSGGNFFVSLFARILIGKIFIEPRYYFAVSEEDNVEDYSFEIDPSGFAITLGFEY